MPMRSQPSMIAAGGAEPAIRPLTAWPMPARCSSGALISMPYTMGAPQRCVTRCSRIRSNTNAGATLRRHTLAPACSAMVQGKHHPLQWNMGSVHKYTGCSGMAQVTTFDTAFR